MTETLTAFNKTNKISELVVTPIEIANFHHPANLFTKLSHQPWAIWLDSCETDHADSQYDIIVWQPTYTLVTQGQHTEIHQYINNSQLTSNNDPLKLVNEVINLLFEQQQISNTNLPFNGGALGYFAYDLGRKFEKLPNIAEQDIQQPEMAVGIYQHAVIFDRKQKQFLLLSTANAQQGLLNEISKLLKQTTQQANFKLTSTWQANMSKSDYQAKFEQVQNYLLSGDCYQINLAQRFTASYQGDEFQAYLKLREHNKAPFSAFMRLPETCILSISPERFLQVHHNKVQTKPIKGTRPRSLNSEQDQQNANELLNASKDRAENLMIVDLLRNDISKVCQPGTVEVPKLFAIESFPAVHHLVSTVEGKLAESYSACDLLRGAFPGGSITGAPKIRAMEIIDELEPHRRHIYCGSIGYISACGNMDTNITIRTLICEQQKIHCWAGGGLVADSNVDSEYQETIDKVNKILPILAKNT